MRYLKVLETYNEEIQLGELNTHTTQDKLKKETKKNLFIMLFTKLDLSLCGERASVQT